MKLFLPHRVGKVQIPSPITFLITSPTAKVWHAFATTALSPPGSPASQSSPPLFGIFGGPRKPGFGGPRKPGAYHSSPSLRAPFFKPRPALGNSNKLPTLPLSLSPFCSLSYASYMPPAKILNAFRILSPYALLYLR